MDLRDAHRGYDYQDLLSAVVLVDVLLGTATNALFDRKLFEGDLFDDLTFHDSKDTRRRFQIKHSTEVAPAELSLFSTKDRDVRLDTVVTSIIAERDTEPGTVYTIVLRLVEPVNENLTRLLAPEDASDSIYRPFFGRRARRFSADALCPRGGNSPLKCLRDSSLSVEDVSYACERLWVEFGAPPASFDLVEPLQAEERLRRRAREELGAGVYPNESRSEIDVARALIGLARAARAGRVLPGPGEISRALQFRRDFGAVARAHPVKANLEVLRPQAAVDLLGAIQESASQGKCVVVTAPPGHGKSWLAHQVHRQLRDNGWVVAEHYCYLSEVDEHRSHRVHAQRIFGSLLRRVEEERPDAVQGLRPRFAASADTLVLALEHVVERHTGGRVALVVDGLDHIDRVTRDTNQPAYSAHEIAEDLAAIQLPANTTLVVLSQPGAHLDPFRRRGACFCEAPRLAEQELRDLADRLGIIRAEEDKRPYGEFLATLADRSQGNALYATYLCRQVVQQNISVAIAAKELKLLPAFDGTLHAYYQHLIRNQDDTASMIADILSLLDFAVTRSEFADLVPAVFARAALDASLDRLSPVLAEVGGQGGVRVYHESFARFLRQRIADADDGDRRVRAVLTILSEWLRARGFLTDPRAYRFLLPTLHRLGEHREVICTVSRDFAVQSIAAGWMPGAIYMNLAVAVQSGGSEGNWPFILRCVELARATWTFEEERLETDWLEYADVAIAVLGIERFVSGLLFEGRPTVPARSGVQLCALVDRGGGIAPWREYLDALARHKTESDTSYPEDLQVGVTLAESLGRLRLNPNLDHGRLCAWVERTGADETVPLVLAVLGRDGALHVESAAVRGDVALVLAESLGPSHGGDVTALIAAAMTKGLSTGYAHRALRLAGSLPRRASDAVQSDLLAATSALLNARFIDDVMVVERWLDLCLEAAQQDATILRGVEVATAGVGWFRCWLRFALGLVELEVNARFQPCDAVTGVLECLTQDLNPFTGEPRACDLYRLGPTIGNTLRRALALVPDGSWERVLAILREVSERTATTLQGSAGGPLTTQRLLDLVVEYTTPPRYEASKALVRDLLGESRGHRYYSELAAYRLCAARLAVKGGELETAHSLWADGCRLMLAYGFRKDSTLWELLDPVPALGGLDLSATAQRLAPLAELCLRVRHRTDGKGTRHAIREWWEHMAWLDPHGCVTFAATEILGDPNESSPLLDEALDHVWRRHAGEVDPFLAAMYRYTSPMTLEAGDKALLGRVRALSKSISGQQAAVCHDLMRLCLARADECSEERSMSNGNEYRARDNVLIAGLNEEGASSSLPIVESIPLSKSERESPFSPPALLDIIEERTTVGFSPGVTGLAEAINRLATKPLSTTSPKWSSERYQSVIGYRLLELLDAGESGAVEDVLFRLARSSRFGETKAILEGLAEGLDTGGYRALASVAYSLTWITTRGGGGWLSFGGEESLAALERAFELDSRGATKVLVGAVFDIVAEGNYRMLGVSRALITGLTRFHPRSAEDAWDECFALIAARLPALEGDAETALP